MSTSYVPLQDLSPNLAVHFRAKCLERSPPRLTRRPFQFEIEIYSDASSKQPIKDLVRSKILPQLRKTLATLTNALITEHAKDLQHAPGVNPSAGFTPAPLHPQTSKKEAAPTATPTTSTTGKVAVNTTTVTASDEFRTTAEELYNTFTDPQRIAAFTRGAPRQFEGAQPGGKFAIFDGNVTGEFVKLDAPKQIVQKWRLAQWPEGHFSSLEINLDQNDVDGVTQLRVEWSGVPIGQEDVTKQNWELYYVRSIKQTFGYVANPCSLCLSRAGTLTNAGLSCSRTRSSQPLLWTSLLTFVLVLLLGIGLALFSDQLHAFLLAA